MPTQDTNRFLTTTFYLSILKKCSFICLLLFLTGCSGLVSKHHGKSTHSSSLSSFLYPNKQIKIPTTNQIPQLTLPAKVGIAFLPSRHWRRGILDSSNQYNLLKKIKTRFSHYPFVENITIIPSIYLRHHTRRNETGFDTLDQVAKMHNVDVIALVSYDQLTQTHHTKSSLLYWTIVGMYVIPGNENTIQTFVDTAIFDVKSRKLLMRAPGISKLRKRSTAIDVDKVMNDKSLTGFNLAVDDMIVNLDQELQRFKALASNGETVNITNLKAYSAAGSLTIEIIFLLLVLLFKLALALTLIPKTSMNRKRQTTLN